MSGGQGDAARTVYAAAQGRSFLRNELSGKSNEWINEFAGFVETSDEQTLDLLNYYCDLWRDRPDDFLDTRMATTILSSAATESYNRAFFDGNVSVLQGGIGLTDNSGDGADAIDSMSNALRDEGAIYLALGPPGSGKTATAIDVASAWRAKTGGTVITNITSWARADRYAEDSEAARDLMGSIDGPTLLLLDEVAQSISSSGEDSKAVTAMAKFLKYIRKEEAGDDYAKQGSALLIGHTENDTGKDIRRLATGAFQKPSREDPTKVKILTSEGGTASFTEEASFSGLTDTAEDYGEHEASAFRVITDADDVDDDAPSADEAAATAAKRQAIETAIRACKPWSDDDGMNYRDAAALVPYGKSWVGDRVREWQDGDYRDLVDSDGN